MSFLCSILVHIFAENSYGMNYISEIIELNTVFRVGIHKFVYNIQKCLFLFFFRLSESLLIRVKHLHHITATIHWKYNIYS